MVWDSRVARGSRVVQPFPGQRRWCARDAGDQQPRFWGTLAPWAEVGRRLARCSGRAVRLWCRSEGRRVPRPSESRGRVRAVLRKACRQSGPSRHVSAGQGAGSRVGSGVLTAPQWAISLRRTLAGPRPFHPAERGCGGIRRSGDGPVQRGHGSRSGGSDRIRQLREHRSRGIGRRSSRR
jgi:hypothetical protein